jgi:hypothetical protein
MKWNFLDPLNLVRILITMILDTFSTRSQKTIQNVKKCLTVHAGICAYDGGKDGKHNASPHYTNNSDSYSPKGLKLTSTFIYMYVIKISSATLSKTSFIIAVSRTCKTLPGAAGSRGRAAPFQQVFQRYHQCDASLIYFQ